MRKADGCATRFKRDAFHTRRTGAVVNLSTRGEQGSTEMASIIGVAARAWDRVVRYITERNDQAVAAWGSSLQYKRRYTNPDDAKRARKGF